MRKKVKLDCVICGNESEVEGSCIHCMVKERQKKNPSRKIQKHHWCCKCFSKCPEKAPEPKKGDMMTFDEFLIEEEKIVKRIMSPHILSLGISITAPNEYWVDIGVCEDYL